MKITKTQLKEIIREELTTLNEKLINNPNQVLKGKTILKFLKEQVILGKF